MRSACPLMAWRWRGGGVFSLLHENTKENRKILRRHMAFFGIGSGVQRRSLVCTEDVALDPSELMSAIHLKDSSSSAPGLCFSNVSQNDARGERLRRGPTDAGRSASACRSSSMCFVVCRASDGVPDNPEPLQPLCGECPLSDPAVKSAADGMFASLLTQSFRQASLALATVSVNM